LKKFILLLFLPTFAYADVISSDNHGFQIVIERIVKIDKAVAYKQFLKIGEWWNADHTWFGKSENLSLDTKAGGCFCEKEGAKEVLHMLITFVDPGNELKMVGGLGPLQMMGLSGGMSWKFEQINDSETKISHHYQVSGYTKGGLIELAKIVDNVQTLQVESLVMKLTQ